MQVFEIEDVLDQYAYVGTREEFPELIGGSVGKYSGPFRGSIELFSPHGNRLDIGDFMHVGPGCLCCDSNVISIIGPMIHDDVEFLPIIVDGKTNYSIVNPIRVVDCLDLGNSYVTDLFGLNRRAYSDLRDGDMYRFLDVCFLPEKLEQISIFRIRHNKFCFQLFTTEGFKDLVQNHDLTGIEFVERTDFCHIDDSV